MVKRSIRARCARSVSGHTTMALVSGSCPPRSAHGRVLVFFFIDSISPVARNLTSRRIPTPPRHRPAPPESRRNSKSLVKDRRAVLQHFHRSIPDRGHGGMLYGVGAVVIAGWLPSRSPRCC